MKVGSKLHNGIGILLIVMSVVLAVMYWDESIVKSVFYFLFAIGIGALILFLTKKRKEIEQKGE